MLLSKKDLNRTFKNQWLIEKMLTSLQNMEEEFPREDLLEYLSPKVLLITIKNSVLAKEKKDFLDIMKNKIIRIRRKIL